MSQRPDDGTRRLLRWQGVATASSRGPDHLLISIAESSPAALTRQGVVPSMFSDRAWLRAAPEPSWSADDFARRPVIIANPSTDWEFRQMIDQALAAGRRSSYEVETILRTRYPNAVVRPRELEAERIEVWYVYRDGHWIRSERDVGI